MAWPAVPVMAAYQKLLDMTVANTFMQMQVFEVSLELTPFSGCKGESLLASKPSGLQVMPFLTAALLPVAHVWTTVCRVYVA